MINVQFDVDGGRDDVVGYAQQVPFDDKLHGRGRYKLALALHGICLVGRM